MNVSEGQSGQQRRVQFLSDRLCIRGVLQLPVGDGPHPIVVLGHGLGALKEWTLPDVAAALAQVGIAVLWFDFRNFGDSDGQPRDEVSHYGRLEDWQNAISYAGSLPEIDPERIGIWGTSLGGRDVLAIASFDRRVRAVVCQTPLIQWNAMTAARMAGFGEDIKRFQREVAEDRTNRIMGKEPRYVQFVKPVGDDLKAEFISSLSAEELRNYTGQLTLQSYQFTTLRDITGLVDLIAPTPLLFTLAESDSLPGQREAYAMAGEPKSLVTVNGHHFSPYTTSKEESIAATREWFVKHLMSE